MTGMRVLAVVGWVLFLIALLALVGLLAGSGWVR